MCRKLNFGSHDWKKSPIFFRALIHTIWLSGHNVCLGQSFAPKLKVGLIQYRVRPKPKLMSKSPNKRGPYPFEYAQINPKGICEKKKLEVKRSFYSNIKSGKELG